MTAGGRTGGGDPARTLELLWRHSTGEGGRRGPRPRLSVDAVVDAAVGAADEHGLGAVSMRGLAAALGVSPMTLYTYVPGRAELLDLMIDRIYLQMPRPEWPRQGGWRARARAVAEVNRALYRAHPWAAGVSTARPPLGPGLMAKYEHELDAFDGLGLTDLEMDGALTFLLSFVQAAAASARDAALAVAQQGADAQWWEAAGPLLARFAGPERYPLAARVGTAAGEAQNGAYDAERAYAFGLERLLDGLAALVDAAGRR